MGYGCKYGQPYGSDRHWHPDDQGYEHAATPDTVYLGKSDTGALAELAVDRSQYLTDLTVGANYISDPSSSTRWRQPTGRTLDCRCVINSSETGRRGIWTGNNYGVWYLNGTDLIARYWNGSTSSSAGATTSLAITLAAGANEFVFSWSTEANPDTTASTNAYRSEMRAWNLTTGTFTQVVWTHAVVANDTTAANRWLIGDETGSGSSPFLGTAKLVRLCSQFHSATETYRTLVAAGNKPTLAGEGRLEPPTPSKSSGIGDDGQFAGPVYALAAANARQQDLRLWAPVLNDVYNPDYAITFSGNPTGNRTQLRDPLDTTWYLQFPFIRRRPLPPNANRLKVRVCLYVSGASAGATDTITVRCYSMSQPGWRSKPSTSPAQLVRYYRASSVDVSDANSGTTVWLEFSNLKAARDLEGATYLALAFRCVNQTVTWQVRSWVADPVLEKEESMEVGSV